MKTGKRITKAYCVDLQRVVTITEARQEYFSQEPKKDLHFLCSTEDCRKLGPKKTGVKVTGVNYRVPPQEDANRQNPHFRANPVDVHDPSCEWVREEEADSVVLDASQLSIANRAKRKLDDHVDVFDPETGGHDAVEDDEAIHDELSSARSDVVTPSASTRKFGAQPRKLRSNSLERLVQYYRSARAELSEEEFEALTIQVKGMKEMPLYAYFRSIEKVKLGENDRVIHGGARYKKFGMGFRFSFYDKFENKPISLYISPEQMRKYRYRGYWEELFKSSEQVRYYRVYALGNLVQSEKGDGYNFIVDDLRKLAIVLGPMKEATGSTVDADSEEET
jgi:hypothetical protein